MEGTRKLAAILVADVVGYSRLAGADEDRTLARLRGLRSDLIDPAIAAHRGRIVKPTGDGILIEFRSVVDAGALRCRWRPQGGPQEPAGGLPAFRVDVEPQIAEGRPRGSFGGLMSPVSTSTALPAARWSSPRDRVGSAARVLFGGDAPNWPTLAAVWQAKARRRSAGRQ
jgi:class 3 adenylate cyclase